MEYNVSKAERLYLEDIIHSYGLVCGNEFNHHNTVSISDF